jgi:hypothetical protein
MKSYLYPLLFLFLGINANAQNQVGLIPQVITNFKVGDSWKINTKLEGRQLFIQNPYPDKLRESEFERLDAELIATRSLDPLHAIGGGYLIRRADKAFLHRFIQQYAITRKLSSSRMSHRFRTDQTWEKDESLQLRLRYRLSIEKPLNGLELDPGEFYLKLTNEYLGILQDAKGNLEIRGLASLGYDLSDSNQIETGIDYRMEKMLDPKITHKLFLSIGLYHSF